MNKTEAQWLAEFTLELQRLREGMSDKLHVDCHARTDDDRA